MHGTKNGWKKVLKCEKSFFRPQCKINQPTANKKISAVQLEFIFFLCRKFLFSIIFLFRFQVLFQVHFVSCMFAVAQITFKVVFSLFILNRFHDF
jgi:hypothetical protein